MDFWWAGALVGRSPPASINSSRLQHEPSTQGLANHTPRACRTPGAAHQQRLTTDALSRRQSANAPPACSHLQLPPAPMLCHLTACRFDIFTHKPCDRACSDTPTVPTPLHTALLQHHEDQAHSQNHRFALGTFRRQPDVCTSIATESDNGTWKTILHREYNNSDKSWVPVDAHWMSQKSVYSGSMSQPAVYVANSINSERHVECFLLCSCPCLSCPTKRVEHAFPIPRNTLKPDTRHPLPSSKAPWYGCTLLKLASVSL
jgi:hypothetical protein